MWTVLRYTSPGMWDHACHTCHNYIHACTIACISNLLTVTFIEVFKVQSCIAHYILIVDNLLIQYQTIVSHFHSLLMVNKFCALCNGCIQACANVQLWVAHIGCHIILCAQYLCRAVSIIYFDTLHYICFWLHWMYSMRHAHTCIYAYEVMCACTMSNNAQGYVTQERSESNTESRALLHHLSATA